MTIYIHPGIGLIIFGVVIIFLSDLMANAHAYGQSQLWNRKFDASPYRTQFIVIGTVFAVTGEILIVKDISLYFRAWLIPH
jgi:hypothetical protein